MTTYRHAALKFRFQCLSRGLFHIDTVAIVSAPSASPYTSLAIASPRVRANFIRHTRRFFSDSTPILRPEKGHTNPNERGTRGRQRKGHRSHLHGRVACCTARPVGASGKATPSASVRSLSASYYYSTAGTTCSQRASFTYRDSPRMREEGGGHQRNARDTPEKRTSGVATRAGHWQRKKKIRMLEEERESKKTGKKLLRMNAQLQMRLKIQQARSRDDPLTECLTRQVTIGIYLHFYNKVQERSEKISYFEIYCKVK